MLSQPFQCIKVIFPPLALSIIFIFLRHNYLTQWFAKFRWICPTGDIWQCLETFFLVVITEEHYWHLISKSQGSWKINYNVQSGSLIITKNYLVQNVGWAKVKKLWYNIINFCLWLYIDKICKKCVYYFKSQIFMEKFEWNPLNDTDPGRSKV